MSNKGWLDSGVELEFNRGSTAVRPIFSKVKQILAGVGLKFNRRFFHFIVKSHGQHKIEPLKIMVKPQTNFGWM
jgi:hypothetical protein